MIAFRRLKMKRVKDFLASEESVKEALVTLENKTEDKFRAFLRAKPNVARLAKETFLD